ncbi:TonB-dependent receptor [Pedobacter nyackensis]|uniref:SusC/RagA family TonB-linked outer membrane protein n=1 Tax=Pedobacter nyackensis TaxID=475255 RepID=UPI00293056D9|nr:TonB-dependent receptor [Pedobacter nyackensis]
MKEITFFIKKMSSHVLTLCTVLLLNLVIALPNIATASSVESVSSKSLIILQQKDTITGLITDANGGPLVGVIVLEKGTDNRTTSNSEGKYNIKVSPNAILEFRYVGYNNEERKVSKSGTINVRMTDTNNNLEDVVVVGYGQQKKTSVVSALNTISSKELSMPTRSLSNNLAGQIAGVLAVQRSGEPGKDNSDFWIRGVSSFAGGTRPLVLVDGVPRNMNDVTVDEIESFSVLKDAAATAVYGAEGANGVVLITTKRGATQKPTLDVRSEYSMVKSTRMPQLLNSYDYLSLYNDAVWEVAGNPANFTAPFSPQVLDLYRSGVDPDLYPNADFLSLMKDNTQNKRVTLNLRGGSERVKYFLSSAFYNENGIFDSKAIDKYDANIGLSRYNLRSNIDINVTKTTDLSIDMSGQYTDASYPGKPTDEIFGSMFDFAPHIFPLRFSDGKFSEPSIYNGETGNPYNKLNESGYQKQWNASIQSKVALNQRLDIVTQGLSLKLIGSFDADYNSATLRSKTPTSYRLILNDKNEKEFLQVNEGSPDLKDPSGQGSGGEKRVYLEGSLNYKRLFNNLHDVSGLLLYMQKENQLQGSGLPFKKQSVVARVSYGYDNRYMAEGSFGLTGSENFAKGYRYGIFPAVGVAWYVSNEKFMKATENVISKLKFRASYGLTGNDNVGGSRFPYRGSLNSGGSGYNFGFNVGANGGPTNSPGAGIIEAAFAAPYLSWEVEEKKNIGLDLGLLGGRIDMSVDVFRNDRRDILMQRKTVSAVTGFRQTPWQNFGKVTNKGLDGNVIIKQKINDVTLNFRGNLTYAKNKVIEYDEVSPRYDYQRYTGQSLNTPLLYIADGLYKNEDFIITPNTNGGKTYTLKDGLPKPSAGVAPGDVKYLDLSGDGKIDDYDRTYDHGYYSEVPEWVYGFGLNADYKGFYAGIFFQGVANASMSISSIMPFRLGQTSSARQDAMNHWSSRNPDDQNVLLPRLHTTNFQHNTFASTWWYKSANFIRLKNLEFGYVIDSKTMKKLAMRNARIYVQGNNLAVWDNIKMWDPELGSSGGGVRYPINMTWTLGLELSF